MISTLQYYIIPCLYIASFALIERPWIVLWVIYTLIPIVDELFSLDWVNAKNTQELTKDKRYKFPLYLSVVLDWLFLLVVLTHLTTQSVSILNIIGLLYLCGNLSSTNFTVAHELLHKDNWLDKNLGTYTMLKNLYMHYSLEHVFGHHRLVGTPLDAASAPIGVSLNQFLSTTVVAQWKAAHKHSKEKMQQFTILNVIMIVVILSFFGFVGLLYFLVIVCQSVSYLEASNYVEHYGLRRKELSPGQYEPITMHHSWNSPNRISNYLLFKLQRHSDHHEHPYKEYQILNINPESPQYPCSYLVAIVIAFFGSVWFDIMDPLVADWRNNKEAKKKILAFMVKVGLVTTTLAIFA